VHNFENNTEQNSSDNLPSYLQTIIIAQMLSIGGEERAIPWPLAVCHAHLVTVTEYCIKSQLAYLQLQ